jgi:hypothetical protein
MVPAGLTLNNFQSVVKWGLSRYGITGRPTKMFLIQRAARIRASKCAPPAATNAGLNRATLADKRKVDEVLSPLSQKYSDAKDEV